MSARNPHYCELDPYHPMYRDPEDCPGCERDRWLDEREAMLERHDDELRDGGFR